MVKAVSHHGHFSSSLKQDRNYYKNPNNERFYVYPRAISWGGGGGHTLGLYTYYASETRTPIGDALHQFKHSKSISQFMKDRVGKKLVNTAVQFLRDKKISCDVIVAIPPFGGLDATHPVAKLAKWMGEQLNWRVSHCVGYNQNKKNLSDNLNNKAYTPTHSSKLFNVENYQLADRNVLLFEDEYRGGNHPGEIIDLLLNAGAKSVYFLSMANSYYSYRHVSVRNNQFCVSPQALSVVGSGQSYALDSYRDVGAGTYTPIGQALHEFKYEVSRSYEDRCQVGNKLANTTVQFIRDKNIECDVIIPVPSSNKDRFLQPVPRLAKWVGEQLDKPVLDCIRHTRDTKNLLTKDISPDIRHEYLKNLFKVEDLQLRYKNVLIIDDIYDTGATANEVAKAALRAGATSVSFLAMARTQKFYSAKNPSQPSSSYDARSVQSRRWSQ